MATLGGIHGSHSQNSIEIDNLARFAVDEHNKKEVLFYTKCIGLDMLIDMLIFLPFVWQNALFEFGRVIKAKEQVVAGTLHHLTLEVIDAGKKKLYEAKVWVKPWMNFKELQEFKHLEDVPNITPSDLGVKQEGLSTHFSLFCFFNGQFVLI